MHIYLVQHGDALSKTEDEDRPLSEKGRKNVSKLASFMAHSQLPITSVLHSGKLRAQQTALIYSDTLGLDHLATECPHPVASNDPIGPLVDAIQTPSQMSDHVMLIGHLPHLGKLVSSLVTGNEDANCVQFEPGGVVALERNEASRDWTIQWVLRPSLVGG